MKILIMGFGKIKFMPYMNFYLDNINREKHDLHLLYWNRDLQEEDISRLNGVTRHELRCYQEDDVPKHTKIKSFIKYRNFALDVLKKGNFDFLCVVHSLTGVVLWDYIRKNFRNKYIFDYRDATFEKCPFFKFLVGNLVKHSKKTFVSSDAFRKFLPEKESKKIFTCHNIDTKALGHTENPTSSYTNGEKIKVGFWGFVRDEQINYKIIEQLGDDPRFELHYYGREQQIGMNLKKYAQENNFENVFFHGEYKPEERYEFIKNIDLVHNIYDDDGAMLAVGNKYYDAIMFRKPQMCMAGSFMGRLCTENRIGFECNPYDANFAGKLYERYKKATQQALEENFTETLLKIIKEQEEICEIINKI